MCIRDRYREPYKKQENWPRLDLLFENGCILHEIQYNNTRISYFPVKLRLPFFLLIFLLGVSILVYLWIVDTTPYILLYMLNVRFGSILWDDTASTSSNQ